MVFFLPLEGEQTPAKSGSVTNQKYKQLLLFYLSGLKKIGKIFSDIVSLLNAIDSITFFGLKGNSGAEDLV